MSHGWQAPGMPRLSPSNKQWSWRQSPLAQGSLDVSAASHEGRMICDPCDRWRDQGNVDFSARDCLPKSNLRLQYTESWAPDPRDINGGARLRSPPRRGLRLPPAPHFQPRWIGLQYAF